MKWYAYGDRDQLLNDEGKPTQARSDPKLVGKPSHGRCAFTIVPSLPWPPKLNTKLELRRIGGVQGDSSNSVVLRISTTNTDTEPVTVQTRGQQRFLVSWGPMQPEEGLDSEPRIIDSSTPGPISSLYIIDKVSGTIVRRPPGLGPSGPGVEHDPRPKLDKIVTIKPEDPLVRLVDISKQLAGCQMEFIHSTWSRGERGDVKAAVMSFERKGMIGCPIGCTIL